VCVTRQVCDRCIIARLPPTRMDFATSLKHKRKEFNIADLIGSLDVEGPEKATRGRGVNGSQSKFLEET
jgi:hypothetical protein